MKQSPQKYFILLATIILLGSLLISIKYNVVIVVLPVIIIFIIFVFYYTALFNKREKASKEAEEGLQENQKQIKMIFNAAPDAVIVINEEGKIIEWNSRAESMFGWSFAEVEGKLLSETIIPEAYRESHQKGMQRFLKTGETSIFNKMIDIYACTKTGGEISVALSISPAQVKGKYIFIGFIRDITEQKKRGRRNKAE